MPEQASWTHSGLISMHMPGSKVLNRLKRWKEPKMDEPARTFVELTQACGLEYY